MAASLPPDLSVLCRKLTSTPPPQLAHSLPSLINHVLHCKDVLSAPQEQKVKGSSSEASRLVHKLKSSITTLLNGRTPEGRFAAIALVKATVDVGGWEVLRGSEPWVRGLLAVVQKGDAVVAKELAIVTLTRIYIQLHPYQTLVREIATPTIPAFITAVVALSKQDQSAKPAQAPVLSAIETVFDACASLIPLYPTTFRPQSSQLRAAARPFIAPTQSDEVKISRHLQRAARRLTVSLHHVAAKSGGSDEWAKLINGILKELHLTADQVLRAVNESWESSEGYGRSKVDLDNEPTGGATSADQLPVWTGIAAGSDRLIGLFSYLADALRYPTKAPVTIPTSAIVDAASRVFLVARLSPKSQQWDQALQANPAVGRDEREELWSVIPDIHIAALQLLQVLVKRLDQNAVALVPELLDHLVRVFKSGLNLPGTRAIGYKVLKDLLALAGPTFSAPLVDSLGPLIGACCRDLQQDVGHLKQDSKQNAPPADPKKTNLAANADLFLKPQDSDAGKSFTLGAEHKAAATCLLAILPSHLPQRHLKASLRGLVDQTAIVTQNREAIVASVLNPFRDQRGRLYPSILPHLTQLFPNDQSLEMLRTNLRATAQTLNEETVPPEELEEAGEEDEDEDEEMEEADADADANASKPEKSGSLFETGALGKTPQAEKSLPIQNNPFEANKSASEARSRAASPPKRKHEGSDDVQPKRQILEKSSSPDRIVAAAPAAQPAAAETNDDDDDDDESVHLNMELEEDDDDEED